MSHPWAVAGYKDSNGNVKCSTCGKHQSPAFAKCIHCCTHDELDLVEHYEFSGWVNVFWCKVCGKNFEFTNKIVTEKYKIIRRVSMSESDGTTIHDMVASYLVDNGYDGLFSSECGCLSDDLAPCGEIQTDCIAGYKIDCPNSCTNGGECDFHVGPDKPVSIDSGEVDSPLEWDFDPGQIIFPHDPNKKLGDL